MDSNRITRRDLLKAALLLAGAAGSAGAMEFFEFTFGGSQGLRRRSVSLPWDAARQIVAETTVPAFPDSALSIANEPYGAVGDGATDNTVSFKRAIEDCSSRGGGHVIVPAGVYSTGAIQLLNNVDLHLESGAILRFNSNVNEYPLVLTRYEGIECLNHSPMIYAYAQNNIGLTGKGILEASETRRWNTGSNRAGVLEPLVSAGLPPEKRNIPRYGRLRSAFVEPYRCANVVIQGVTMRQSQFWQLHPTLCRNVTVDSVTTGDTTSPNTDGCNPESCDHVVIKDCTLNAYDDCIGIKSGRDADGRRVNTPCQNVVIFGCRLQGPAGGIACGSEMTGGIRNIYAFDVEADGAGLHHMLYVKSNTRRGGYTQNLNLDSVTADHLSGAWAFAQMDYDDQAGPYPPCFKDWAISRSGGDFDLLIFQLSGLSSDPIRGIRVRDCEFTHALVPLGFFSNVEDFTFARVTINGRQVSC